MEEIVELKKAFFDLDKKVSESLIEISAKFDIIHQDITNKANLNSIEIDTLKDKVKTMEKELEIEKKGTIKLETTINNFRTLLWLIGFILSSLTFILKFAV